MSGNSIPNWLAAVLLAALPAPLVAQYGSSPPPPQAMPPGKAAPDGATPAPAPASRAELLRAAVCVVGHEAEGARALLATTPFSPEERDHAARLLRAAERCLRLRSQLATSALMFRGAVAEALYESAFALPPAARNPAAAAAAYYQSATLTARADAPQLTTHFELAQCAAPGHGDLVRALLATEPGTDAEMAALTALYPVFASCVRAGTQLRVDRGVIRAFVAEALYRWSVVQRDGPTSPLAAPAAPAG